MTGNASSPVGIASDALVHHADEALKDLDVAAGVLGTDGDRAAAVIPRAEQQSGRITTGDL